MAKEVAKESFRNHPTTPNTRPKTQFAASATHTNSPSSVAKAGGGIGKGIKADLEAPPSPARPSDETFATFFGMSSPSEKGVIDVEVESATMIAAEPFEESFNGDEELAFLPDDVRREMMKLTAKYTIAIESASETIPSERLIDSNELSRITPKKSNTTLIASPQKPTYLTGMGTLSGRDPASEDDPILPGSSGGSRGEDTSTTADTAAFYSVCSNEEAMKTQVAGIDKNSLNCLSPVEDISLPRPQSRIVSEGKADCNDTWHETARPKQLEEEEFRPNDSTSSRGFLRDGELDEELLLSSSVDTSVEVQLVSGNLASWSLLPVSPYKTEGQSKLSVRENSNLVRDETHRIVCSENVCNVVANKDLNGDHDGTNAAGDDRESVSRLDLVTSVTDGTSSHLSVGSYRQEDKENKPATAELYDSVSSAEGVRSEPDPSKPSGLEKGKGGTAGAVDEANNVHLKSQLKNEAGCKDSGPHRVRTTDSVKGKDNALEILVNSNRTCPGSVDAGVEQEHKISGKCDEEASVRGKMRGQDQFASDSTSSFHSKDIYEGANSAVLLSKEKRTGQSKSQEPTKHATQNIGIDLQSLGLSCQYSAREHEPKYSEEELSVKVAAAVAQATTSLEEKLARLTQERERLQEKLVDSEKCHASEVDACTRRMEEQIKSKEVIFETRIRDNADKVTASVTERVTSSLMEQVRDAEERAGLQEEEHRRRVQAVRDEHTAEIDELISQLDALEEEHNSQLEQLRCKVTEKETVISALSTQLVEANSSIQSLQSDKAAQEDGTLKLKEEISSLKEQILTLKDTTELLKAQHQRAIEGERAKRQQAVEKERANLHAAAEEQFSEANKHYMRLKGEYESTRAELQRVKDKLDLSVKDAKSREVSLLTEVARLKADFAASEANAASATQKYASEIDSMRSTEESMKKQLEEANAKCSAAHISLAHLARENDELKSVSEELMAMVEGNQTEDVL